MVHVCMSYVCSSPWGNFSCGDANRYRSLMHLSMNHSMSFVPPLMLPRICCYIPRFLQGWTLYRVVLESCPLVVAAGKEELDAICYRYSLFLFCCIILDWLFQVFFLTFVGTDRLPVGGIGAISFVIQENGPDSDLLPTASTCYSTLPHSLNEITRVHSIYLLYQMRIILSLIL